MFIWMGWGGGSLIFGLKWKWIECLKMNTICSKIILILFKDPKTNFFGYHPRSLTISAVGDSPLIGEKIKSGKISIQACQSTNQKIVRCFTINILNFVPIFEQFVCSEKKNLFYTSWKNNFKIWKQLFIKSDWFYSK